MQLKRPKKKGGAQKKKAAVQPTRPDSEEDDDDERDEGAGSEEDEQVDDTPMFLRNLRYSHLTHILAESGENKQTIKAFTTQSTERATRR